MQVKKTGSELFSEKRDHFIELLNPVFLPSNPFSNDIVCYFASLLRVLGMEDGGWDPYAESRSTLEDLNSFLKLELPGDFFKEPEKTPWRVGLLLYTHIVEMDAPYEVLTNLLRFQLGKGYSPNPFFDLLSEKEKANYGKRGISTGRKIEIIKQLSDELGFGIGSIFDEFYDTRLRNAVAHSDYILADDDFRCRGGLSGRKGFRLTYEDVDKKLLAAKAYIAAFFQIELDVRRMWGENKQSAFRYDPIYKGLIEVLVGEHDVMCGFKVHWPNMTDSMYLRTETGVEMENCMPDFVNARLGLMVGQYATNPDPFSPLVEKGERPKYTMLQGVAEAPNW